MPDICKSDAFTANHIIKFYANCFLLIFLRRYFFCRTLKLGIVFCLILITGGLCFAFLFPRKVYFSINDVMVWRNISLTKKDVAMNLTVWAFVYLR